MARREYGSGSIYQRQSDGRWVGTYDAGVTRSGGRRRPTVTGKSRAEVQRKLRDKMLEVEKAKPQASGRMTVKLWAKEWLDITERTLRPKTWGTNRGAIRNWIVPTIGNVRLTDVGPRDIRAVATSQRNRGIAASSILRTQRVLIKMLRDAVEDGHTVPASVFAIKAPGKGTSDRQALEVQEALAMLAEASGLPHGSRWAVAFLQGMRQGECLGLTWDSCDFERDLITVDWQLQALPYVDRKDKSLGFRIPDDYEARHLTGAFHLVRPKSQRGLRVIPMVPWIRSALLAWREVAPPSPYGLVWPNLDGSPTDKGDDLDEWKGLQGAAGAVGHPGGRYYHTHEARHTTATLLMEAGVPEVVIIAILGHSSIVTSRGYMHANQSAAREAMETIAARLELVA